MSEFSCNPDLTVPMDGADAQRIDLVGPILSVSVVPRAGGEVSSLKVLYYGERVETLHRALDYGDPGAQWRGRVPLQWPAVGRNCVPEELTGDKTPQDLLVGSWRADGVRYPMPILGFAQYMPFDFVAADADDECAWVELRATDGDYSRQYYPYAFELVVRYIVEADVLRLRYTVRNREAARAIPFSIGNHITVNLPFTDRGAFDACTVSSPTTEKCELTPQDMIADKTLPKDLRDGIALTDPDAWNMAMCGYTWETAAIEVHDPASFGLRVGQRELTAEPVMDVKDVIFVLYAEPGVRSFCPEPWVGRPNSLNTGVGAVQLAPGAECVWEMTVTPLID